MGGVALYLKLEEGAFRFEGRTGGGHRQGGRRVCGVGAKFCFVAEIPTRVAPNVQSTKRNKN